MKKVRMNISHFRFILFNLKIFGEIATTFLKHEKFFCPSCTTNSAFSKKWDSTDSLLNIIYYYGTLAAPIAYATKNRKPEKLLF